MYPVRNRLGDLLTGGSTPANVEGRRSDSPRETMTKQAQDDRPASVDGKALAPAGRAVGQDGAGGRWQVWLAFLLPACLALGAFSVALTLPQERMSLAIMAQAVAVALTMLALYRGWELHQGRRRKEMLAEQLARALAHDPDPVIVSDEAGKRLSGNPAAQSLTLEQMLARYCAEPARVIDEMQADALEHGHARRLFLGHVCMLRVGVHCLEGRKRGACMLAWRLESEPRALAQRPIDMLGLPVLTLGSGEPLAQVNPVLRELLSQDEAGAEGALDALLVQLRAPVAERRAASIVLPDQGGARLALPLPAPDGQIDVLFLPAALAPSADAAGVTMQPDFEDIPVALMHIAPDGSIRRSNREARKLLGMATARRCYFSELVEGLGRPVEDWLADAVAGRALNRPEVLRATLPAQETFVQVIFRRAPAPDDSLVAVISDATELKSLEARFVQSQKMQAIGQLAGGVAHDFNNLLTAISGHCDLLLLNRDHYDPDYSDLIQIHQNANRAAALVRQLLAFSRKQTLKPEWLSLESLLEDLTHLLTRLVGERITLSLVHDRRLHMIRTDRRQFEQVILNLVVNARDAMPMGGEIRIETEALTLTEEMEQGRARLPAGHYAVIRVIDEGIGIPADILDKIFEPFFTTKKLGEGTGLGLSTAYGIVKQMGGYIFAESNEGTGTVFTLYFATPVNDARYDADEEESTTSQPVPASGAAEGGSLIGMDRAREAASEPDRRRISAPMGPIAPVSSDGPHRAGKAMTTGGADGRVGVAAPVPHAGPARPPRAALPSGEDNPTGVDAVVLLVEDESPVRAFAARALRLHGYQVIEAESGEQALEFLAEPELSVDIFVSDVVMPGIDGPGWVNRARQDRPDVPVVFMSGHTQDNILAALSRTPGAVFLDKPFTLQALCETIDRQLDAQRDGAPAPYA